MEKLTGNTPRIYFPGGRNESEAVAGCDRTYNFYYGGKFIFFPLQGEEAVVPEGAKAHMDLYSGPCEGQSRREFPAGTRIRVLRKGDILRTCKVEVEVP